MSFSSDFLLFFQATVRELMIATPTSPNQPSSSYITYSHGTVLSHGGLRILQAVLLKEDSSVWCISSWNDNGHKKLASNPKKLFRTSFFPGLGWMMVVPQAP
jgi:hypothetical protein|uniref:Alpha-1,3-mannosyl-glycoprotein 2-beta-N-acetylglucosaminyltransferase n=1 Tax=Tetraselmis chuii TaxID=63592 RepID=A0A7S1T5V5_9CHLO|mmetsp:Transcript_6757/g.12232  ORF Transcript_6757/g.12232 Transcript_6757/m.12232 type:complete len:102 (+) Transcript_6757:564-869(+)